MRFDWHKKRQAHVRTFPFVGIRGSDSWLGTPRAGWKSLLSPAYCHSLQSMYMVCSYPQTTYPSQTPLHYRTDSAHPPSRVGKAGFEVWVLVKRAGDRCALGFPVSLRAAAGRTGTVTWGSRCSEWRVRGSPRCRPGGPGPNAQRPYFPLARGPRIAICIAIEIHTVAASGLPMVATYSSE